KKPQRLLPLLEGLGSSIAPRPVAALAPDTCYKEVVVSCVLVRRRHAVRRESRPAGKTNRNASSRFSASPSGGRLCERVPVCRVRRLALLGPSTRYRGATMPQG